MCFNIEVSLGTFIFTWSVCIYLLNKGLNEKQQQNIIFLMIIGSMQLVDAVLWYNGMKKNKINYIASSFFVPFLLSSLVFYNVFVRNDNKDKFTSAIAVVISIYFFYKFNGYSTPLCNNKLASPVWASSELKLWEVIPVILFIHYPDKLAIFLSFFMLLIIRIFIGGAYGSLWCSLACLASLNYLYNY